MGNEILEKINQTIELLNDIEDYDNGLAEKLSNADSKLSDLYHLIEQNKLKTNECYRVMQELRKVLLERRKIKDDIAVISVFKTQKEKLMNDKNRSFLKQAIYKKNKELHESVYKNRIYTENEISELLEFKTKEDTNERENRNI